jgi:hypothetical protein
MNFDENQILSYVGLLAHTKKENLSCCHLMIFDHSGSYGHITYAALRAAEM